MIIIFEQKSCLRTHAINNTVIGVVYDEKLIFIFVTLLQKADNVDTMSQVRHKFRYKIALYDIPFCSYRKYSDLSWLDVTIFTVEDVINERVMARVINTRYQPVYAFIFQLTIGEP